MLRRNSDFFSLLASFCATYRAGLVCPDAHMHMCDTREYPYSPLQRRCGSTVRKITVDGTGECSSTNARSEASVSVGVINDTDSATIISSSSSSSNLSQQLVGLDNLAAAISSPSLRTSLVFVGVLAALAAQGGAAHAADSAGSVVTHHQSAQAVFGACVP